MDTATTAPAEADPADGGQLVRLRVQGMDCGSCGPRCGARWSGCLA